MISANEAEKMTIQAHKDALAAAKLLLPDLLCQVEAVIQHAAKKGRGYCRFSYTYPDIDSMIRKYLWRTFKEELHKYNFEVCGNINAGWEIYWCYDKELESEE